MFYLNFEDFSIFKLRATIFMIMMPITFTNSVLNIWLKLIPAPGAAKPDGEEYTKEELEGIAQAKHAIKDFVHSLSGHLKSLNEYLNQVMREKPL